MTRIILTRHGHVEGIVPPRFRGRRDVPLTETGRKQAAMLAEHIAARYAPAAIYTSPLSRCVATGAFIEAETKVPASVLDGLIDFDYGDWTGKTHEEVAEADPAGYARWWTEPQLVQPLNGDSLSGFVARVTQALLEVLARHEGQCVVLVGHDSTNRALLLTLMDLPFSAYWRFEQSPCGISEIDVPDNNANGGSNRRARGLCVNETLHLERRGIV